MNTNQAKATETSDRQYAELKARGGLVVTGKRGRRPRAHQFRNGEEVKYCGGCNQWHSLDAFGSKPEEWDGLTSRCRSALLAYRRALDERRAAAGLVSKNRIAPGQRYARYLSRANGTCKTIRLYIIWDSMVQRCTNPKQKSFYRYGGRGITICSEWLDSYDTFRTWAVTHGYRKELTLDRIDVNGNYGPTNCRWLSPKHQQWNSRVVIRLTLDGTTKPLPQWAEELGLPVETLRQRHSKGWPDEHVLTVPRYGKCPGIAYGKPGRKPASAQSSSDQGPNK